MRASVERRRFRRAELDVPVSIRAMGTQVTDTGPIVGEVKNISLAGVYCHVKASCALTPGQSVLCSVMIPEEQSRWFPFTRVTGKGSVVRLEPVPVGRRAGEEPTDDHLVGMAIAFASDVTALGTIPMY